MRSGALAFPAMPIRSFKAPRGAAVVEAVFTAALEEMARVGYAALSVEGVAALAGVNRTSVYRRWPSKGELVTAAFASRSAEISPPLPRTESLRDDFVAYVLATATLGQTALGRAVFRMFLFDHAEADLAAVRRAVQEGAAARGPHDIVDRAIARGELSVGFDRRLIIDPMRGVVIMRALLSREKIGRAAAVAAVDAVLHGAVPPANRRKKARN